MMPLMLFGFMTMLVDAALWGIAAYLIFVLISHDQKHCQLAAWISAAIYFVWDEVIGSGVISGAGVNFTNRDVSRLVGDDFAGIDFFDVLFSVGLAYGGFFLGRYLFRCVLAAVQTTPSHMATASQSPPQSIPQPEDERNDNMTEHEDIAEPTSTARNSTDQTVESPSGRCFGS